MWGTQREDASATGYEQGFVEVAAVWRQVVAVFVLLAVKYFYGPAFVKSRSTGIRSGRSRSVSIMRASSVVVVIKQGVTL